MKRFIGVVLFLAACGGAPSASSICKNSCDKQAECNNETTAERTTCENGCDNDPQDQDAETMVKMDCKNADEVIDAYNNCVVTYCTLADLTSCTNTALGTCEAKN